MSQRPSPPSERDLERLLREAIDGDRMQGVVLLGADRRVLYANGTARMVLGLPGSGLEGQVLPEPIDTHLAAQMDRARSTRAAQEQELPWDRAGSAAARIVLDVRKRGSAWVAVLRTRSDARLCGPGVRDLQARWPLTLREAQVAEGVSRGLANSEVAGSLGIVEKTVKNVLMSVYLKVGVRNRVELALRAHGVEVPSRQA